VGSYSTPHSFIANLAVEEGGRVSFELREKFKKVDKLHLAKKTQKLNTKKIKLRFKIKNSVY